MRDLLIGGVMAVTAIGLAACDVQTQTPTGNDEKVAIKADGEGRVAFDLPFAKGEVKLPAAMMRNAEFDIGGVKMMPGASVSNFDLDATNDKAKVNIAFTAPTTPAEARAYFLDQFKAKGIAAAGAADAITGKTADGATFVIRLAPDGTGSKGTIDIEPRP